MLQGMTTDELIRLIEAMTPIVIALFGLSKAGAAHRAAQEAVDVATDARTQANEVKREQIQMTRKTREESDPENTQS